MPIFLPNVLTRCTVFTSAFWSSVLGQNIGVLRLSLLASIYTRGSHQTENHFQEQIVFNDHQRLDSYSAQVVCKNILGTCNVSSFQQNNFFLNPDPHDNCIVHVPPAWWCIEQHIFALNKNMFDFAEPEENVLSQGMLLPTSNCLCLLMKLFDHKPWIRQSLKHRLWLPEVNFGVIINPWSVC